MKILPTGFEGLFVIEPVIYHDTRGYFLETWREGALSVPGKEIRFVQDNFSWSGRGVVRGLHYQTGVSAQAKLVMACHGEILDVAVDLRKGSPTFGRHFSIVLESRTHRMLFIPEGFAHGFSVLSEQAAVAYKCSAFYDPELERGIRWNDPQLLIDWQIDQPMVSEKDRLQPLLSEVPDGDLFTMEI